jgi:signal transduction histidine kinase
MMGVNSKPQRVLLAVLLITLAVFGTLVAGLTWHLRSRLREEALRREAEAIHSVALLQLGNATAHPGPSPLDDPLDELLAAVLESSRLRGVLAVQLFDASGELRAAEPVAADGNVAARWWPAGLDFPRARFVRRGTLETVYGFPEADGAAQVPLLEVVVPLRSTPDPTLLGVARYWIDGASIAAEFARTDRRLWGQAGVAYAGGTIIILLVIAWAFRRLSDANRRLEERGADLARANQELDFAAKTGAIGAISAHLIHGLKNPLSGLEGFVIESAPETPDAARGEAWRTAVDTTRRLRSLVNEVVDVLRDEATGEADYRVPVQEIVANAQSRVIGAARQAEVAVDAPPPPRELAVLGRTANLAQLILENLLMNAVESSPRNRRVTLDAGQTDKGVEFVVSDQGPGLPPYVRQHIFRPLRSVKPGGGGVGLAISHQLARHAGGALELVRSDADGTVFRLLVPAAPRG